MPLTNSRRWLVIVVLAASGVGWATWRWYEYRYPTWEEEVQLSDGRVTVVKQKHEYYDNYGTAQSWLTFSLPEMGGERTWHSYLQPMRVDVVEGKVYVFGRPRGPKQVQHYRYPQICIVAFAWSGSDFERIPLRSVPANLLIEENTFSCVQPTRATPISIRQKEGRWCLPSGDQGQFRRQIDLAAYRSACDAQASLARAENRSE